MSNPLAQDVVETLYRTILKREADPSGMEHFTSLIARGASSGDVAAALLASPEYRARLPKREHPLASFAGSYSEKDISFFMHRGRFRPLTISIETINICNNDCVICPYSAQTRKRQTMPLALFTKVIRDYVEIGGGPISLTPLVGEVLLDKHLPERLALLKETPSISSVSATTNAVMVHRFDDDRLRSLLDSLSRVLISVYGLDRDEYAIMTKRDEYHLFRQGLVRVLSLAKPGSVILGLRLLKRHSQEEIAAWRASLERDAGVSPITIASVVETYANWSYFDTSKPLPLDGQWRRVTQNTTQCGIPLLGVQIMSDGRVSFCACANFDGTPELVIGDLNKQSLAEILDTPEVADLWNWKDCGVPEFCTTCSFHIPLDEVAKVDSVYRNPFLLIGA